MEDDFGREEIGRKGAMGAAGTALHREGEKMKEGWQDFKAKIRQKWNQVTDKDLDTYQARPRNDLVGHVHSRVGGDRMTVERDIDSFARDTRYKWD